jgi:hypothetical protein
MRRRVRKKRGDAVCTEVMRMRFGRGATRGDNERQSKTTASSTASSTHVVKVGLVERIYRRGLVF